MTQDHYKTLRKKFSDLFADKHFRVVLLLFIAGLFLRLYRLDGFVTFLGDQGRDAIIIRRILTLEHWPAIGAPTSVGQVYLGPFYYYFMAPWLALFAFNPIGLAFGTAIISSLFIVLNYFLVKDLFNEKVALISTFFITFSKTLIDFSRFSWNPNLLPIFSFLFFYFFIKARKIGNHSLYFAAGALLSFSLQLHYLALFLILAVVEILIVDFIFKKKTFNLKEFKKLSFFAAAFIFFTLPLLIFDIRHGFLNTKNFINLFKASNTVTSGNLGGFINSFNALNNYSFFINFPISISLIFLVFLIILTIKSFKNADNLRVILIFFLLTFFGISVYSGPKYAHYLGPLFVLYYLVLAYLLAKITKIKLHKPILAAVFAIFVFFNFKGLNFFSSSPSNQIEKARVVAADILENIKNDRYQLTAIPDKYSDSTYRYFLEIWGKRALDKDTLDRANELFVVCEKICWPIGNPQWEIAYFAATSVEKKWQRYDLAIYKLKH